GTLATNTRQAATGATQLAAGARTLQTGVNTLIDGNLKIKGALGQITANLPDQKDLEALSSGGRTLATSSEQLADGARKLATGAGTLRSGTSDLQGGARQLRDGLVTLRDRIPTDTEQLGGDPDGLARSVQVRTEDFANVANNGSAFAPYFIALALWVGATLTTFIFPFLLIPDSGRRTGQVARVLRKLSVPLLIVAGQAGIVVLGVHLMDVPFMNPAQVLLTSLAGSVTFLIVILALNLLFGPAGRVLALILLIVQLAASGGSYPVELSSPAFQAIHNLIPVTELINALRHAMFGAFEGQYWEFMGRMGLVALIGFIVALLSRRRWVYTPDDRFRSPIITDVG
ncbi:YhgE/Pip domain-containing protein, partial [Deinococcus sp. 6YEL10]|uniref:YhgE/Pip family protein n=1 Tax=Deinococcus sp. 6YEL10 TaxID=2745870 RepID=UPI001E56F79C